MTVSATKAPAIFVGHGSPTHAITGVYAEPWRRLLNEAHGKPRAILCVSGHWYTRGTAINDAPRPKTIHDFYNFPREFYDIRYGAPGAPWLAERVQALAPDLTLYRDQEWGFDHGCWSVLLHAFPDADVPVTQLSIDGEKPAQWHYDLGRKLAPLRDEGVMILGSGVLVHNLRSLVRDERAPVAPWAADFMAALRGALESGDDQALIDYEKLPGARYAIPTPDHYLPLLYALGARDKSAERPFLFTDEMVYSTLSMLSVGYGAGFDALRTKEAA